MTQPGVKTSSTGALSHRFSLDVLLEEIPRENCLVEMKMATVSLTNLQKVKTLVTFLDILDVEQYSRRFNSANKNFKNVTMN